MSFDSVPLFFVQVSPAVGLMSPMQFTSVPKKSQSEPSGGRIHSTSTQTVGGAESKKVVGLTKSQMQQSLVYLITVRKCGHVALC